MPRKFLAILTVGLATICSVARAEPAMSYLGMCSPSWSCEASLAAFDGLGVIRVGWLEGTFGDSCPCADRLLTDRRRKEVRVHVTNGACVRNKRCGPYEPFAGETIQSLNTKVTNRDPVILGRYGKAVLKLKRRLERSKGGLTCWVSPMLESNLNDAARAVLHSITVAILPDCVPVDSVLGSSCLPGTVCETHGAVPRLASPCISDMDGTSSEELDPDKFFRNSRQCDLSFVWDFGFNCTSQGAKFKDPRARDCTKDENYFVELGSYLK